MERTFIIKNSFKNINGSAFENYESTCASTSGQTDDRQIKEKGQKSYITGIIVTLTSMPSGDGRNHNSGLFSYSLFYGLIKYLPLWCLFHEFSS